MAQQQEPAQYVDDYADEPELLPDRPLTFVERTYTRLYLARTGDDGTITDMYVYIHPNGLCVLGLAPANGMLISLHDAHKAAMGAAAAVAAATANTPATDTTTLVGRAAGTGQQASPFTVKFNPKLLDIKANAKKKSQGTVLEPPSLVCHIHVRGTSTAVKCGIKGKLLEVNHRLEVNPELLVKRPNTDGFLAILAPLERDLPALKQSLLTVQAYMQLRSLTIEQLA